MKKKILSAILASALILTTLCSGGCFKYTTGTEWFYSGEEDSEETVESTVAPEGEKTETPSLDDSQENTTKPVTKFEQSSSSEKEALTVSQVYEKNVNSVAGITTKGKTTNIFGQQSTTASSGTGIVISEDGYIVTNYHVVEGGDFFSVALYDGSVYEAKLVGYDAGNDVALLKVDATGLSPAACGNSDEIIVGEDVVVIGNPLGELTYTLTRGVVSALNRAINTDGTPINMFQIDAAVNSGNSGGPAFDATGNVIGMVTAKYADETIEGLGFCIPINDVVKIANELVAYGYVRGKAALEIGVEDAYSQSFWGTTRVSGAYVSYVIKGGCAEKAGLKKGSLINYVNNTAVTSADDMSVVMRSYDKGDTVTIKGYYNNKSFEIEVTLAEYSPNIVPEGWTDNDGIIV